jgi:hypothetical protein
VAAHSNLHVRCARSVLLLSLDPTQCCATSLFPIQRRSAATASLLASCFFVFLSSAGAAAGTAGMVKAVRCHAYGGVEVLQLVDVPQPTLGQVCGEGRGEGTAWPLNRAVLARGCQPRP